MQKYTKILTMLAAMSFPSVSVGEETPATDPNQNVKSETITSVGDDTPKVVNSDGKYKGDKLSFPYDVVLTDGPNNYCLPSGEVVRIQAYDEKVYEVYRISNWGWTSKSDLKDEEKLRKSVLLGAKIASASDQSAKAREIDTQVTNGKTPEYYCATSSTQYLPRRQLVRAEVGKGGFIPDNAVMSGFSYGVLLVPYKYYTDSKNFGGAVTVAPFAGYRIDWSNVGIEATLVGFAGPTSLQGKDDSGDSTNLFGLSYGAGLLFEIKNDFNLGFVLGADKVSKSDRSKFEDDSDMWFAISLGFDFSN